MKRLSIYPVLFCFSVLLNACDSARVFEQNKTIPDSIWDKDNRVNFEVDITQPAALYNMYVNVRNAGNYGYSNLFLFMDTRYPDGFVSRDTIECILAAEDGRWLGDGSGDIFDNRILFRKGFKFPMRGTYRFVIEQGMRQEKLAMIMDVGIRIELAEQRENR